MHKKILFLFIILLAGVGRTSVANDSLQNELLQPKFDLNSPAIDVPGLGADWKTQRIARLDKQVIAAVADGRRREVRREVEPKISALLAGLCAGEPDKANLQRLSGAVLAVRLRRAYHSFPLRTERDELRGSPLAQNDLALGRHLARYAEALAAEDHAAQVAVLQELLSGLLVLSADQVETFAERLGEVLEAHTHSLADGCTETRRQAALSVAINPALLVFDLAKYRGFNATHRWFETQAMQLRGFRLQPARLYTFDPVAGVLIGFDEPALILDHMDELIDPENIAFGHCSVGQMASAGAETGRFACTLGPQCKPGGGSDKRGKGGIFGFDLSRLFGGGGQQAEEDGRPERSPFGLPTRGLGDNCVTGGAGGTSGGQAGGGSGGGGAPFGRGGGGFAQCMANAAFEKAIANDPARCMLAAQQRLRDARNNETIIVGQGEGGPVIKGIYGNDNCTTDPRMSSPGGNSGTSKQSSSSNLMQQRINETIEDLNQKGSAARAFVQASTKKELSESDFIRVSNELKDNSRVCDSCLDADTLGETEPREGKWREAEFTFDAGNHESGTNECDADCYFEMLVTVWHEATHAAEKLDRPEDASHADIESSEDAAHEGQDAAENTRKQAEEMIGETKGGDGTKMPDPGMAPEPCGPVADAFREMMACTSGQVAGMDGGGNPIPHPDGSQPDEGDLGGSRGNTDGNVDPTEEQWINDQYGDNAFSRCMAAEGMTVVGNDGRVYQIGGDKQSRESCSTITCRPPAEPTVVNDMCRCVVEGQRERIGAIIAQHERTRHCGRMMVDCSRTPNSPCCEGGAPGIQPDLGPRGPGGDPEIFKPDTRRFDFDDKLEPGRDDEPKQPDDDPEL
ncbi:hypothetical protein [Thiohalophilus thiocyanatoxydans]|uniref:Lysine-specific metallo-endopeptidase family protein n=1 Tax=Thiohalophilus thiocyanatoxydans TaxID=381308 RepID=A0A4R8IQK5_9GAMM|nr:hypothetical protein [Thiohalophilus thiocyanatoxydans]TDX99372.1 hypothetical protein EDC23_2585 [Thiohalophilus thiocyanatoxydans]